MVFKFQDLSGLNGDALAMEERGNEMRVTKRRMENREEAPTNPLGL